MADAPLLELTRGSLVESVHRGSIAVVDANGKLLHSHGDPQMVAFLRSSAKPFQALPFVEHGGVKHFGLTPRELALACASHEGSALHLETVLGMQKKIGIQETQLQCGVHMPGDAAMFDSLVRSSAQPGPNLNNCSGKHTAMLAYAKMRDWPLDSYLELDHPIQQDILTTFAEMCGIEREEIEIGVDGCSAPNFAVPLFNAALGLARLADPRGLPDARGSACREITAAMTAHSEMISGPGEFDCELMKAGAGKIVCKRGAEGYQAIGLLAGVLGPDSPGIGITFKVSDGDGARMSHEVSTRARPAVALETLRQLGALSEAQLQALSGFGPARPIVNHRGLVTGEMCPAFTLE
ncbi:MAG TPA: asparaginase [Anaerolineales bacterium]|jgi:L-asparaginase II